MAVPSFHRGGLLIMYTICDRSSALNCCTISPSAPSGLNSTRWLLLGLTLGTQTFILRGPLLPSTLDACGTPGIST